MNRFHRGIISGTVIVVTLTAIALNWLTSLQIPVWAWMTWIALLLLWTLYDSYVTGLEGKRIRAQIDRAIEEMLRVKDAPDMEPSLIGDMPIYTHPQSQCEGRPCCIHNPSDHHMRKWGQNWRADKAIMERICHHGVGHPDPDDAEWRRSTGRRDLSTHGCDGCCVWVAS